MKKRLRSVPTSHRASPSRSSPRRKKEDEGEGKVLSETMIYRPTLPSPKDISSSSPLILAATARILEVTKKEETNIDLMTHFNLPTLDIASILKEERLEGVFPLLSLPKTQFEPASPKKSIYNQLSIPSSPRTSSHLSSSSSSSSLQPFHILSSSSIKSLHAATREVIKNISELDNESQMAYNATVSRLSQRAFQEHATFIDIDTSPKKDDNDNDQDKDDNNLSYLDPSCHNSSIPTIVRKSSHSLILSGRRTDDIISEVKEKEKESEIVTVQVLIDKEKDKESAKVLIDKSTTTSSVTRATQRSAIALERLSKDHLNIELIAELQAAVEDLQAILSNVV